MSKVADYFLQLSEEAAKKPIMRGKVGRHSRVNIRMQVNGNSRFVACTAEHSISHCAGRFGNNPFICSESPRHDLDLVIRISDVVITPLADPLPCGAHHKGSGRPQQGVLSIW